MIATEMTDAHNDLFKQINNAVLDLQGSQLQSYQRPLKTLARLLAHEDLAEINRSLTDGVDLEAFIKASEATQGGMVGSASLEWPDDPREAMGLTLKLIEKLGENPDYATDLGHQFFYSGRSIIAGVHSLTGQLLIPFVRDYKAYVLSQGRIAPRLVNSASRSVFIVHGHDGEAREAAARFLSQIGFKPIILHEQASRNRTVIEKIETHSDVGFAIVLLTPDDEGRARGSEKLEPRARQNVLLELGYFMARLGRERVCALKRGEVEIPSDFAGVVWHEMDAGGAWRTSLGRELDAAGYAIDWNAVMRG